MVGRVVHKKIAFLLCSLVLLVIFQVINEAQLFTSLRMRMRMFTETPDDILNVSSSTTQGMKRHTNSSFTNNTWIYLRKYPGLQLVTLTSQNRTSKDRLPLCDRNQVRGGRWEAVTYDRPPYISKTVHLRCQEPDFYEENAYETFEWRPSDESCHFTPWNASEFCGLLRRGMVSIIGDSLSWEHYSSMLQLLGERVHQMDQHRSKANNTNHVQHGCGSVRFVFRNDPRLEYLTDSIKEHFPIVLILNRGAHYENDTTVLQDIRRNIQELQSWQDVCARLGIKCHLFWRTTVPGHANCIQKDAFGAYRYTRPINNLTEMEDWVRDPRRYDNITYKFEWHWQDFARQNELILQELQASNLSFSVLDAYHLNILRPDGHRVNSNDCLHNCYPSTKLEVYSQLLLHFLKMERNQSDVELLEQKYQEALNRQQRAQHAMAENARGL